MPQRAKSAEMPRVEIPPEPASFDVWTWGSVIYQNDAGEIVGYGYFERESATVARLRVTFDPLGVELLGRFPQPRGV